MFLYLKHQDISNRLKNIGSIQNKGFELYSNTNNVTRNFYLEHQF